MNENGANFKILKVSVIFSIALFMILNKFALVGSAIIAVIIIIIIGKS